MKSPPKLNISYRDYSTKQHNTVEYIGCYLDSNLNSELPSCGHISPSHFRKINWLLVEHRVELCTSTTVFKYWKGIAPSYLNDMFMPSLNNYNTRSQMALDIPLCRTNKGQKSMSFLGPKIWNKVSSNIKTAATTSSFTHCLKKEILSKLQE